MIKLITAVLLITAPAVSFSQWYHLNTGVSTQLRSVSFINSSTGWSCGVDCVIKTTDGGSSWKISYVPGDHRSILFVSSSTGYIAGGAGRVLKTSDGGSNWQSINTGFNTRLNQIGQAPDGALLVAGNSAVIIRSTDEGNSWASIFNVPALIDFFGIKIVSSNSFIVSGNESTVIRTSNTGTTWESISIGMPNPLFAVEFAGQQTGYVTGCCGMFMKTTNAGISWTADQYLTPGYSLYDMHFADYSTGWLIGEAGYILRTTNAGQNWDSLNSNTQLDLFAFSFADGQTGYACGHAGTILKTTNGGGPGTPIGVETTQLHAGEFRLYPNYPNPFNPETKIRFELQKPGSVVMEIYDITGRFIARLADSRYPAGLHEATFTAVDLPSGIYHCILTVAGGGTSSVQMMLIK